MNKGIIIQARLGSTRLKDKVLKPLPYGSDTTVLQQVIRRCKQVPDVKVIVATAKNDQSIVEIAKKEKVAVFRGSESNVLSRYYHCAVENKLDVITRITADCPCIDPAVIAKCIRGLSGDLDYVSNITERTYPRGMDVETFTFNILEKMFHQGKSKSHKEHVTTYIREDIKKFKVLNFKSPQRHRRFSDLRITLDTYEDYVLMCAVYDFLYGKNKIFTLKNILMLFNEKPWLTMINKNVQQKKV
jgi:spore coat polysaccharide biosynthesis protein SpsF